MVVVSFENEGKPKGWEIYPFSPICIAKPHRIEHTPSLQCYPKVTPQNTVSVSVVITEHEWEAEHLQRVQWLRDKAAELRKFHMEKLALELEDEATKEEFEVSKGITGAYSNCYRCAIRDREVK